VTDPAKAMHEVQDWRAHIYNTVQLALRALVAAQPMEALLAQRLNIGKQILAMVQPEAEKVGITVHATDVKDVMFPGDLKKVFAEVLKAKQEGQAALERARGESAALRNLANAARLLENNPALQNLRLMQSISASGNTLVMGLPTGFAPLTQSKPAANKPDAKTNEPEGE
jgi:regulator of protease activity HflC (stomatin/prohibitin superfamily)